jgi:hypothetical protein
VKTSVERHAQAGAGVDAADVTFLRPRGSFDVRVGTTLYTTRLFSLDRRWLRGSFEENLKPSP